MNYKDLFHEIKNDVYIEGDNGNIVERLAIQKMANVNGDIIYYFDMIVYHDKHPRACTLFYFDSKGLFAISNVRTFTKENQAKIVKFLAAGTKEWFRDLPTDTLYTIPVGARTHNDSKNNILFYTKDIDSLISGEYGIASRGMVEPANIFFEEKDIDNLKYCLNGDLSKVIDLCKTKVGERL